VFTLLLLEAFIRIAGLQPMHRVPNLHRSAGSGLVFELIPSHQTRGYNKETVTMNSLGFRSPEMDAAKPNIVMVGDSMTFGLGVEDHETNPALLQAYFPGYNVINTGVSSYNIEQEVLAYEQKAMRFNPELVILQFVINDADPKAHETADGTWTTEEIAPEEGQRRLREAITKSGTWRIPGKVWLHQHSALFMFIERRTKGMWFRAKTDLFAQEWTPQQLRYYDMWFSRLTASIGNRPKLFVRWPDNWLHPRTVLAVDRLAQDRGWTVLDLGDLFGTRYENLGWDQHPSPATQKQAADAMAAFLLREKLLPSSGSGGLLH
jgi:hypothetical protein